MNTIMTRDEVEAWFKQCNIDAPHLMEIFLSNPEIESDDVQVILKELKKY